MEATDTMDAENNDTDTLDDDIEYNEIPFKLASLFNTLLFFRVAHMPSNKQNIEQLTKICNS